MRELIILRGHGQDCSVAKIYGWRILFIFKPVKTYYYKMHIFRYQFAIAYLQGTIKSYGSFQAHAKHIYIYIYVYDLERIQI